MSHAARGRGDAVTRAEGERPPFKAYELMSNQSTDISTVKLGLAVAWPAFWIGVPVKVVFALLFLAMGLHPWEGTGLVFLLILSIPIDIWALNLAAQTVFLERLRMNPPASIGLTLWWQVALMSAVYLPTASFLQKTIVAVAKSVTEHILSIQLLEKLPIAERISVELMMWGTVATVSLILLVLGWLFLTGFIVKGQTKQASAAAESYEGLVRRWDLLRIPRDQTLQVTVFAAVGVFLVLCFWGFLPVTTPHPHEDYAVEKQESKIFVPTEALEEAETKLLQVEVKLEELEKDSAGGKKGKAKKK